MSEIGPRTHAAVRHSRWPGWIWAVPIAAVLVVGWLAIRHLAQGGEEVTVIFGQAGQAKVGDTKVFYRGVQVGELKKVELTRDVRRVRMTLRLDDIMKPYLRQDTRFWLEGAKPSLSDLRSLKGVLAGPTIEMRPGGGPPAQTFVGLEQPPTLQGGPEGPTYPYLTTFSGDAGGLDVGAPVKLHGFTVGEVTAVRLAYDPASGDLSVPVTLALEPDRLGMPGSAGRAQLNQALARWVGKGLRARLVKDPPMLGASQVALEFAPDAPRAALQTADAYPEIPSTAGEDISALTDKADRILSKVDAVPIEQIGDNVRDATGRIQTIVSSPKINDSIDHLDSTLADIDHTIHQVSPQVGPLVAQLRRAADQVEQTAKGANQLVGGSPTSQNSDLPDAIHELTEAARSIRSLADYLDRHPEALIKGRKGDQR